MFKKILLAYDGSVFSDRAAEKTIKLAKANNSFVEILHVRSLFFGYPPYSNISDEPVLNKVLEKGSEEIMAQAVEIFKGSNIPFSTKIMVGDPADIICKEAEQSKADLIVVGNRGLSPVTRYALGNVSSKVLAYAHCSVLVIRLVD